MREVSASGHISAVPGVTLTIFIMFHGIYIPLEYSSTKHADWSVGPSQQASDGAGGVGRGSYMLYTVQYFLE